MSHTSGPWKHEEIGEGRYIISDSSSRGLMCIDTDLFDEIPPEVSEANVGLAASAPQLLAACIAAESVLDFASSVYDPGLRDVSVGGESVADVLDKLRAVIAQAKGDV